MNEELLKDASDHRTPSARLSALIVLANCAARHLMSRESRVLGSEPSSILMCGSSVTVWPVVQPTGRCFGRSPSRYVDTYSVPGHVLPDEVRLESTPREVKCAGVQLSRA